MDDGLNRGRHDDISGLAATGTTRMRHDGGSGKMVAMTRKAGLFGGVLTAALLLSAAPAFAQAQRASAPQAAAPAQAPWYERFTFGSEFNAGANAWVPRGEPKASVKVSPRSNWGVTFGLDNSQQQRPLDRALARRSGATAGAFYDVAPNIRVGGAVVLPEQRRELSREPRRDDRQREPGVKVESAFRF